MTNSNDFHLLRENFEGRDYDAMAANIITALKSPGSDKLRDALNGISRFVFPPQLAVALYNMFLAKLSNYVDENEKAKYVCSIPFFCGQEVKPKETAQMKMSGAAQSVTRTCTEIKNCIHFQIHFGHFDVDKELQSGVSNLYDEEQLQTTNRETRTETETESLVPVIEKDNYGDEEIAEALASSLQYSFRQLKDKNANESVQKEAILNCLQPMLQFCGYDYKIEEHPDFGFIHKQTLGAKNENSVILWCEAKKVVNLPQKPMEATLSAHLCRYGFATTIARNQYKDKSLKPDRLRNVLEISHDHLPTTVIDDENSMSQMVKELLQFSDTPNSQNQIGDTSDIRIKMKESAEDVITKLNEKKIWNKDALNLWTATMQACEASLADKMRFTVVISTRMMWFIKLHAEDEICTVLISDGILIGKENFTQELIRFITFADETDVLEDSILKKWYSNFKDLSEDHSQKENKNNNKRNRRSSSEDDSAETDDEDKGGSPKRRNKNNSGTVHNSLLTSESRPLNNFRAVSTDNSSSSSPIKKAESPTQIILSADDHYFTNKIVSPGPEAPDMDNTSGNIKSIDHTSSSKRMTDEEQMMWQRAFTGLGNADMKYLDQDQYGVIVPYLCQLEGAESESLGEGRCGTVKKIRWNGDFAAMKEYVFQDEDDKRVPSDVYEHELKVFYRLEALWGRCVPRLLFRNPWSCRPSIGMEVGQPMDNDIDSWVDEDKEKMRETIAEIKNEGFKQNDLKGANFVRLNSGYIAMIDFEDVVQISSFA